MKYFKERRRKVACKTSLGLAEPTPESLTEPTSAGNSFTCDSIGKVGADSLPTEQFTVDVQTDNTEQSSQELSRTERCKDRLLWARRRKDIRLTRKEVACLQVLVQTVLNEHLVLSRELQAANERMGLPTEPLEATVSPLARNVERLHSALERDAARLKAALQDRDDRLEGAAADQAALRLELEKWRRESSEDAEKSRALLSAAIAEKDGALQAAAEKDQIISNLRSDLASLESKRSNEVLCMSKALTDKEVLIKKLECQAQDKVAELSMMQVEFNETVAMLEMERTARYSTEHNLEMVKRDLKRAGEDHEGTAIMLSKVLSDKEAEVEDLKGQLEVAKEEFEQKLKEAKRTADLCIADTRFAGEKAVAQKEVEMHNLECELKQTQTETKRLRSELEREKNKGATLHDELAVARGDIANARKALSQLETKLSQERVRHEEQINRRDDQIKNFRSQAASIQTNLESRLSQLQKEASEDKSNMEGQLSLIEEKLNEAERIGLRLQPLEQSLEKAKAEIRSMEEKATERNSELEEKEREVQRYAEKVKRMEENLKKIKAKEEEHVKSLKSEIDHIKAKREEESTHFRKAIHEKDVQIRERQDQLKQVEADQEEIQKSLSVVQKTLEDTTKQHKSSMANAKTAHREVAAQLKQQVSKKSEEIKALQDTVKMLHTKITEQHRQHSQEIDKLKSQSEKTRNLLEKKIKERETQFRDSEEKRITLHGDLSKALESREVIMKELELVRDELKRTVDILWDARAETRLALDTMADTERAMISIYADSIEKKLTMSKTQSMIDQLEEKWLNAQKASEERKDSYVKLKSRFLKFMKMQEDERKAAGDSVEQNRAEAMRYLDELKSSRTELASTEERCRNLQKDLESALQKIQYLSANETALLTQAEQNKQLLGVAETEVESLKSDLCRQSSDMIQLQNDVVEAESKLEILRIDLNKERDLSAKQSSECEDAFALIESVSKERHLVLDPEAKLHDVVHLLLKNIRELEAQLEDTFKQFFLIKEEHKTLQEELSSKTSELCERDMILIRKDESMAKLQAELGGLHEEMSEQQNKMAVLEKYLEKIQNQANYALETQETLRKELEEGTLFLHDANSRIDRLTSQLEHERSRASALEQELCQALAMKDCFQQEVDKKSASIQDLSESLSKLQSELHSIQRTDEAVSLQERLTDRDREVSRLLSLLEHAHQECECKAHYESADGDGNKETHSDGLKELKSALAERDTDVAKLRSVIVDLQGELSLSKSTADDEIASYRYRVEELSNEIKILRRLLEEQEMGERAKLDLHLTAEQTLLGGQEVPRVSPRRRPGAPGGAPVKRTVSDGNGEWENDLSPVREAMTHCTDAQI